MKVYRATYILNSHWEEGLVDWFQFDQYKDDKWKKADYGFFYPDGYTSCRAEDEVQVYNSLCHAKNEKYFDREITGDELKKLENEMRLECITALQRKLVKSAMDITNQINHILKGVNECEL